MNSTEILETLQKEITLLAEECSKPNNKAARGRARSTALRIKNLANEFKKAYPKNVE